MQALGIATVPQGAIAHYADIIRKHVAIAPELHVICGISFGYEKEGNAANSFRIGQISPAENVVFVDK